MSKKHPETALSVPEVVRGVPVARPRRESAQERRQRESAESEAFWSRVERIAVAVLPGAVPALVGAVGGVGAFHPTAFNVNLTQVGEGRFATSRGAEGGYIWRVRVRLAVDFPARSLTSFSGKLVGGLDVHFGFPTEFEVDVWVPGDATGPFDIPAAREKAKGILANQMSVWGFGIGGTLGALASSIGSVARPPR